jgi:hypothetical protein
MVKIALFGGAAYLAYRFGLLSFLGLTPDAGTTTAATPGTSTTGTTTTTTAATPPAASAPPSPFGQYNTLDKVYTQFVSQIDPSSLHNVDEWNFFLMQAIPGFTAPDPMSIFPQRLAAMSPPWTRDMQIPLITYWAVIAPWLKQQQGLTGLGHFGSLAASAISRRRYA